MLSAGFVGLPGRGGGTINCSQYAGGQSEGSYRPSSIVGHKMLSLIVTHTEVNNKAVDKFWILTS